MRKQNVADSKRLFGEVDDNNRLLRSRKPYDAGRQKQ